MFSAKIVIVVVLFVLVSQCDAWRRRRRRRCPVRDCDVTSWSYWSYCSTDQCGHQGHQSRSRTIQSNPSCGGAACPDNLHQTRLCYGSTAVHCQLSYWSQWSACTTACGVSGTQTSFRHKITLEQCGGSCTSTFTKTRACSISCFNGGSVKGGGCVCKKGYSGECCDEKQDISEKRPLHCFGHTPIDCLLSSWSGWSACTTVCGVSGIQISTRHRITLEQCGGKCTSTFSKTRPCPVSSCLHGGSLRDRYCFCTEGYSGYCCEKRYEDPIRVHHPTSTSPISTTAIIIIILIVGAVLIVTCVVYKVYKCCRR